MSDIVQRLRHPAMMVICDSPQGGAGTGRAALHEAQVRADMAEAADEIERLRGVAGCCSDGPSFADIRKDVSV